MEWCCLAFEGWYGQAGERGIGILIGRDSEGYPQFTLQYRAVERGLEKSVVAEVPTSIVLDVQLQYCPWCGRRLGKWYSKHIDALYRPDFKIDNY